MINKYFFENLKMHVKSIRQMISIVCLVIIHFLVIWPDIQADYDGLDVVYLFRFAYDIGSFSRLLPLLAAFVMADTVAQDICDHVTPFLLSRMRMNTYINCNYAVCAISGFVTIAAGWLAFILLLHVRYPFAIPNSMNFEGYGQQPFGEWLQKGKPLMYMLFYVFSAAVCGSLWACVGMASSAFHPNRKVAIASPFIINILLYNITYIVKGPWHSPSDVAKYISLENDLSTFLSMLCYFAVLHFFVYAVFRLKMKWRFTHA